jgi:hypothetical protein
MHILAFNVVMKIQNSKFNFYSSLLEFAKCSDHSTRLVYAREIADIHNESEDISFNGGFERLEELSLEIQKGRKSFKDSLVFITGACFKDLAPQMRNEEVRLLHEKWLDVAENEQDLFIHVRRLKELGDGIVTLTVVSNDPVRFRRFCLNHKNYPLESVHFSESDEACDPKLTTEEYFAEE